MRKFINRKQELEFLENKYHSHQAELLIIYGRRRIGKTELLLKFCENKDFIYFMGRLESKEDTLRRFNHLLIEKFKDKMLLNNPLGNWDALLDYLSTKLKERLILVIDEFPFLVDRSPEIVSVLQDKWDSHLKKSKVMLILSGSSVGMMEKYALDYKSPLYGRRTGQWKVEKMNLKHLKDFFPKYTPEDLIKVYSVIDTIPGYLDLFNNQDSFIDNLKEKLFSKGEFLYEEVEILLREELRDPSNYMSIISAISGGLTSFNEINQKTSLDKSLLSKYLSILESLGVVERTMPVTDSYKERLKSKNTLYRIKDNFFDFWFRFVYLNKQEIEKGDSEVIISLKSEFEKYVSFKFEDYCQELVQSQILGSFNKIGRWWHKDKEIDFIAWNEEKKEILFGECKWREKVNSLEVLRKLEEKTRFVAWNESKKNEILVIFAKSFSKKVSEFNGKKVCCLDLKDIEKFLKK